MKKMLLLLFVIPSLTYSQQKLGSWKDSTTTSGCQYLQVQKVELGIDEIGLITSPDTVSALSITIRNTCKDCKHNGPDYTSLVVRDASGKIIAQEAINGIPANGKTRLYYVPCTKRLAKLPSELKISLAFYCMDIRWK